jgi:hypothetical protein
MDAPSTVEGDKLIDCVIDEILGMGFGISSLEGKAAIGWNLKDGPKLKDYPPWECVTKAADRIRHLPCWQSRVWERYKSRGKA